MARWTRRELTNGASLCLELASGLLENGAETSRVEESVRMAGDALGMDVEAMVHPTGVTVGFGEGEVITRVARIKDRSINLYKVAELNRLSRSMHDTQTINIQELRDQIKAVREKPSEYGPIAEYSATALTCVCLTLVLGGGYSEAAMAAVAGGLTQFFLKEFANTFPSFLSLFGAGFVSSFVGVAGHQIWGLAVEPVVVGSLLPQMPGLAFVAAVRDLMAGELVAGNARLAEAVVVTLGMASGVLALLSFAVRLGLPT